MGYCFRGHLRTPADSPDYFAASGALSRAGFFQEVSSLAELRKRLNSAVPFLPVGTEVLVERVYRMSRGYEPGKPRPGSTDREERLVLADKGAFYDPKTGKARPPKWRKVERDKSRRSSRDPHRSRRDMRDKPFVFADTRTSRAFEDFVQDTHARSWRPVLEGQTYRAHGSTFKGPLLLVIGRREGRLTSYFLDTYGNVYWRLTGNRFRRIGNVLEGP